MNLTIDRILKDCVGWAIHRWPT